MALSLQDQVALIYTSQGSQRAVARLLGLSHQKVGRILKAGQEGGYSLKAPTLKDPALREIVARGLRTHTDLARAQARRDGIPFNAEVPIYYRRLPDYPKTRMKVDPDTGEVKLDREGKPEREPVLDPATGRPVMMRSERIAAEHVHWVSDKLRDAWITRTQRTNAFAAVTVKSFVNLRAYMKQADERARQNNARLGKKRTKDQVRYRKYLKGLLDQAKSEGITDVIMPIYTRATPLEFSPSRVLKDVNDQIRQKHDPSTGPDFPETTRAASILLQTPNAPQPIQPPRKARARKARAKARR